MFFIGLFLFAATHVLIMSCWDMQDTYFLRKIGIGRMLFAAEKSVFAPALCAIIMRRARAADEYRQDGTGAAGGYGYHQRERADRARQ